MKLTKIFKSLICGGLCVAMALGVSCGKNGGNESEKTSDGAQTPVYDYTVEDVVMDGFFDVATLQSTTPTVEYVGEESSTVKGYMIDGMPYNDKTCRAFFWLGTPSGEKPEGGWPAVLLIHGGGGNAYADWVGHWNAKGYVALALDLNGQMYDDNFNLLTNKEFYHDGSWGSIGCKTDEEGFKKSWTYMNICNLILCHNYLRGLDYVNPDKTFATGISWGGYLTCILSGLDKRFQGFAPVYGCGSLFTDSWALVEQGMGGLDAQYLSEWAKVYDPTAYLPYATKPMLFVSGMTDHAFSAVSHKKSTSLVPGKVFYNYTAALTHGHYYNLTPGVELFFEHLMTKNQPLVNFLSADVVDGQLVLEIEEEIVENATFGYTTSTDKDSHNWKWENQIISLKKGENKIDIPEGAVAVFVAGYHEDYNYSIASTDVFILKQMSEVI